MVDNVLLVYNQRLLVHIRMHVCVWQKEQEEEEEQMYQGSILVKTYFSIATFYVLNNEITTIVSVILEMFRSLFSGDKARIRKKWLKHIYKKLFGGVSRSIWVAALISQIIKGHLWGWNSSINF